MMGCTSSLNLIWNGPSRGAVQRPWRFVSSQLMDSKGQDILYQVNSDNERKWARRLEWAVDQHLDRAEDDLEELHADFNDVLRQSKEAHTSGSTIRITLLLSISGLNWPIRP